MNELFAIDPTACRDPRDVTLLIRSFGPETGRYAVKMPGNWRTLLEGALLDRLRDIEKQRLKLGLERLERKFGLIERGGFPAQIDGCWRTVAEGFALKQPADIDGLVVDESVPLSDKHYWIDDERFEHDASETFECRAEEFARVSRTFLNLSKEIVIIDPYLDFFKRTDRVVVEALLQQFRKGRHYKAVFWTRRGSQSDDVDGLDRVLVEIGKSTDLGRNTELIVNLVDDLGARDKMHGRRLLSIIGGIAFDQGFRERRGRWNEASPMAGAVWEKYWKGFVEGEMDLNVVRVFSHSSAK